MTDDELKDRYIQFVKDAIEERLELTPDGELVTKKSSFTSDKAITFTNDVFDLIKTYLIQHIVDNDAQANGFMIVIGTISDQNSEIKTHLFYSAGRDIYDALVEAVNKENKKL